LVSGTEYSFKVSAVNGVGEGPKSLVISEYAKTNPNQPLSPYVVSSTKTSATTCDMTIGWYPVIETGGVYLQGYKLY